MKHISKKTALGSKKALTTKCNNKLAVHFSKKSDEWASPQRLVEILRKVFKISLDVCSTDFNKICERHFTKLLDGLKQSWAREVAFMNPPYSEIGVWMRKAYESALNEGATVVCLVPARTDTKWWHEFVMQGNNQIVFLKGRLKFGNSKNSAPFPSVLIVMRPPGAPHFRKGHLSKLINDAKTAKGKGAEYFSLAA